MFSYRDRRRGYGWPFSPARTGPPLARWPVVVKHWPTQPEKKPRWAWDLGTGEPAPFPVLACERGDGDTFLALSTTNSRYWTLSRVAWAEEKLINLCLVSLTRFWVTVATCSISRVIFSMHLRQRLRCGKRRTNGGVLRPDGKHGAEIPHSA